MIYLELTQSMFTSEFHQCGRGKEFSHGALLAMYDYLEEMGEDVELDVIAMCCEFSEYTVEEFEEEENLSLEDDVAFEVYDYKNKLMSYVVHG